MIMRALDADALKKYLLEHGFYPAFIKSAIEKLTIADAELVVHCKDCGCFDEKSSFCSYHAASVIPKWFCWHGAQRGGKDGAAGV